MNKYFARVCHRILRIAIFVALMFMLMFGATKGVLISTKGLLIFMALFLVDGLLYPLYGFTKREIRCDISKKRENIVNAFASCNYTVETSEESKMTFRAKSFIRRLNYGFDDRITVISDGQYITVEGLKREVVRIETRLRAFVAM